MRFTLHAWSTVIGTGLAALTLGACSSAAQPPQVASLTTANRTATSAPSTSDDSKRPQLRMDSSQADISAAWGGYDACLKDNGHVMLHGDGTDKHAGVADSSGHTDGNSPDMQDDSPQSLAARKACADKLPLQPPETDQSKNPHYLDQYHVYLTCLTGHGVAVHAIDPFGSGWTYDDGVTQKLTSDQQQQVDHDCQLASFTLS